MWGGAGGSWRLLCCKKISGRNVVSIERGWTTVKGGQGSRTKSSCDEKKELRTKQQAGQHYIERGDRVHHLRGSQTRRWRWRQGGRVSRHPKVHRGVVGVVGKGETVGAESRWILDCHHSGASGRVAEFQNGSDMKERGRAIIFLWKSWTSQVEREYG